MGSNHTQLWAFAARPICRASCSAFSTIIWSGACSPLSTEPIASVYAAVLMKPPVPMIHAVSAHCGQLANMESHMMFITRSWPDFVEIRCQRGRLGSSTQESIHRETVDRTTQAPALWHGCSACSPQT